MRSLDMDWQIEQLKRCEPLAEAEVKALCLKAMEILVKENNVQRVDAPVTYVMLCTAVFCWNEYAQELLSFAMDKMHGHHLQMAMEGARLAWVIKDTVSHLEVGCIA